MDELAGQVGMRLGFGQRHAGAPAAATAAATAFPLEELEKNQHFSP